MAAEKSATLYRMVTDKHVCPSGLRAKYVLERAGYRVDDHLLRTREETDAFKKEHDVPTTPQTFIDGKRVGGYEDTRRFLGLSVRDPKAASYTPVIVLFAIAALLAVATSWPLHAPMVVHRFLGMAMVLLALSKLQDVSSFAAMFLGYDLLARRWVPYAYIYPFAEVLAGLLMLSGRLPLVSAPLAGFIGVVGAVSVFYAVYVQKRDIKCACVGGSSRVPLGAVSLLENLAMIAMAVWTLVSM